MIEWTEALSTGNAQIDNDHRQLIGCVNELGDGLMNGEGRERLATAVGFLAKYANTHFAREEAHMVRIKCPFHGANCEAHRLFAARIQNWVDRVNESDPTALALEIYLGSADWLREHILKIDCRLRECARG